MCITVGSVTDAVELGGGQGQLLLRESEFAQGENARSVAAARSRQRLLRMRKAQAIQRHPDPVCVDKPRWLSLSEEKHPPDACQTGTHAVQSSGM